MSQAKTPTGEPKTVPEAIAYAVGCLTIAFGKHIQERMAGPAAPKMLAKALEQFTPKAIAAGAERIALERPTLYPGDNLLTILREACQAQAVALIGPEREDWERRQRVLEGHWLNARPRDAVPDLRFEAGTDLEAKYAAWCDKAGVSIPDFAAIYRARGLKVPDRVPALRLAT